MNLNRQNMNPASSKSITKPRTYSTDNTNQLKNGDANMAESDTEALSNSKAAKYDEQDMSKNDAHYLKYVDKQVNAKTNTSRLSDATTSKPGGSERANSFKNKKLNF